LAAMAIVLWYIFDRTTQGFLMGLIIGVGGTIAASILAVFGAYSFTRADFFGVRSWIPVVFFAAGVCYGTIGRKLLTSLLPSPIERRLYVGKSKTA